jgi:hypothetical protein
MRFLRWLNEFLCAMVIAYLALGAIHLVVIAVIEVMR